MPLRAYASAKVDGRLAQQSQAGGSSQKRSGRKAPVKGVFGQWRHCSTSGGGHASPRDGAAGAAAARVAFAAARKSLGMSCCAGSSRWV